MPLSLFAFKNILFIKNDSSIGTVDPFAGIQDIDIDEATPDLLLLDENEDEDVNIEAM